MSYLGASIEEVGVSAYKIEGDPVIALIAQLNRFAGKTVNPGAKCGTRNYFPHGALPLTKPLSYQAATMANVIMYDRYNCIDDQRLIDFKKLESMRVTDTVSWAMANLTDVTTQIAQFGDVLGLNAASVGITNVDKRLTPKFPMMTVLVLGGLAFVALTVSRRKK